MKYTGDAIISVGLTVNAPKPLDDRTVVQTELDLFNIPANRAYEGMLVGVIENGNVYMLKDKSKINSLAGWKASYETLQIQQCTYQEYEELKNNTDFTTFTPKDATLPYLHEETYYYIDENTIPREVLDANGNLISPDDPLIINLYLSREWGKNIEASLTKLTLTDGSLRESLTQLSNLVNEGVAKDLEGIHLALETFATAADYVKKEFIDSYENTSLKLILSGYVTRAEDDVTLALYVKKSDLKGDLEEDGYVFVTAGQFNTYKLEIINEFKNYLKLNGDGTLGTITVNQIKSNDLDTPLVIDVTKEGLKIGDDVVALLKDVPVLECVTEEVYTQLVEKGEVNEDVYYYITDHTVNYITSVELSAFKSLWDASYNALFAKQSQVYERDTLDLKFEEVYNEFNKYALGEALTSYYTKTEADNSFVTPSTLSSTLNSYVTKAMLGGTEGSLDGDYIFVTQTAFSEYKTSAQETLNNSLAQKIDKDSDASLTSLTTSTIKHGEVTLSLGQDVKINNKPIALKEEIPVIKILSEEEFKNLEEIDPDIYYCTTNVDEGKFWVPLSELANYYTQNQVNSIVSELNRTIKLLEERVASLEAAILPLSL